MCEPSKLTKKFTLFPESAHSTGVGFFIYNNMGKYNCTIDNLDCLEIDSQEDGIRLYIKMHNSHELYFDEPVIILNKSDVLKLINELQTLIENNGE